MSKRTAGIALLLSLFTTGVFAETPADALHADARVVPLGDNGWELFRPEDRAQTLFDLTYLTSDLWSDRAGLGLRFRASPQLSFDLRVDPFTQTSDLIGPVYGFDIGATVLALRVSF
ncbi:MAG: hypothetical protein EX272_01125 [Chromatiales bacterium]|nr:MAG: hypothetical protein EX272_01125 [Chromatiales bacterium]